MFKKLNHFLKHWPPFKDRFSQNVSKMYDAFLLNSLKQTRTEWLHSKETQDLISGPDDEILVKTELARRKYFYLYREARLRKVDVGQAMVSRKL